MIIYEYATNLSAESGMLPFDYFLIAKTALEVHAKSQQSRRTRIRDRDLIPKLKDFRTGALLGAGGFGAVYKVRYEPLKLTCTLKLVDSESFGQLEQEISDRVVHSLLGEHTCLVNYYCVFSVQQGTIIMMEYIKGVDLHKGS